MLQHVGQAFGNLFQQSVHSYCARFARAAQAQLGHGYGWPRAASGQV
jgi:hypothetical protein